MSILLDALKKAEQAQQDPAEDPGCSQDAPTLQEPQPAEPLARTREVVCAEDASADAAHAVVNEHDERAQNTSNKPESDPVAQFDSTELDFTLDPDPATVHDEPDANDDHDARASADEHTPTAWDESIASQAVVANNAPDDDTTDPDHDVAANNATGHEQVSDETQEQNKTDDNPAATEKSFYYASPEDDSQPELDEGFSLDQIKVDSPADTTPKEQQSDAFMFIAAQGGKRSSNAQLRLSLYAIVIGLVFLAAWWYISHSLNQIQQAGVKPVRAKSAPVSAPQKETFVAKQVKARVKTKAPAQPAASAATPAKTAPVSDSTIDTKKPVAKASPKTKVTKPLAPASARNDDKPISAKDNVYIAELANKKKTTALTVRRDDAYDEKQPLLDAAYAAYQNGHYQQAGKYYAEFLQSFPNNRDALLGLAAVALQQNKTALAQRYYTRVLDQNPNDSIALSGLMALQDKGNAPSSINRLKQLIKQEPKAAHLHFSLGNLYAAQQRWVDAQSAYFSAHRFASNNADYAYNLAISLDQLQEPSVALRYYQLALKLSRQSKVHFDKQTLKHRIQQLQQGAGR